jgi:hypothetical protein
MSLCDFKGINLKKNEEIKQSATYLLHPVDEGTVLF